MKSLGYAPDEEDMSQTEEHEFHSDLIIKIGGRLLLQSRGPFQDGLSVVLGSREEPKSPQTQASAGGGAEHEEQASRV